MVKFLKEIKDYIIIIVVVILIRTFLVTPAIVDEIVWMKHYLMVI